MWHVQTFHSFHKYSQCRTIHGPTGAVGILPEDWTRLLAVVLGWANCSGDSQDRSGPQGLTLRFY